MATAKNYLEEISFNYNTKEINSIIKIVTDAAEKELSEKNPIWLENYDPNGFNSSLLTVPKVFDEVKNAVNGKTINQHIIGVVITYVEEALLEG